MGCSTLYLVHHSLVLHDVFHGIYVTGTFSQVGGEARLPVGRKLGSDGFLTYSVAVLVIGTEVGKQLIVVLVVLELGKCGRESVCLTTLKIHGSCCASIIVVFAHQLVEA